MEKNKLEGFIGICKILSPLNAAVLTQAVSTFALNINNLRTKSLIIRSNQLSNGEIGLKSDKGVREGTTN